MSEPLSHGDVFTGREYVEGVWAKAVGDLALGLSWYEATRDSFVSRNLAAGVPLEEVSSAVGHSSPVDHAVPRPLCAGVVFVRYRGVSGVATESGPRSRPSRWRGRRERQTNFGDYDDILEVRGHGSVHGECERPRPACVRLHLSQFDGNGNCMVE